MNELGDMKQLLENLPDCPSTNIPAYKNLAAEKGLIGLEDKAMQLLSEDENLEALQALKVAAEMGSFEACSQIAFILEKGDGIPQDLRAAQAWHEYAAGTGELSAIQSLLTFLDRISENEENPNQFTQQSKLTWRKRAAELGDLNAMYDYAYEFADADDLPSALKWFEKAAEYDCARSQFTLGNYYNNTSTEPEKAILLLTRAFQNGMSDAGELLRELNVSPLEYDNDKQTLELEEINTVDDLKDVDDLLLQTLIRNIQVNDLSIFLANSDYDMRHAFKKNLSDRAWTMTVEEIFAVKEVTDEKVQQAEQNILSAIQELKDEKEEEKAIEQDLDESRVLTQEDIDSLLAPTSQELKWLIQDGPEAFDSRVLFLDEIFDTAESDEPSMDEIIENMRRLVRDDYEDDVDETLEEIEDRIRDTLAGKPTKTLSYVKDFKPENVSEEVYEKAHSGDAEAQYHVGFWHFYALEKADHWLGQKWFKRAAKQGHAQALYELGKIFIDEDHSEIRLHDLRKGLRLLREAGKRGEYKAWSDLARFFEQARHGVKQDLDKATHFAKLAANLGDDFTAVEWARKLIDQYDVTINPFSDDEEIKSYPFDLTTAFKLLEAAVEKGDLGTGEAEYILFQLHYIGRGTYQNTTIAKQWLEKSKAKHWPEAQTPEDAVQSMENKFADEISNNAPEVIEALKVKVEQKDIEAMKDLRSRYENGFGVPQDEEKGMDLWFEVWETQRGQ